MTLWQRLPLGVLCLGSGGALTVWSAAAIVFAVTQTRQGLTLPYLLALVVGLFILGASADLLGRRRTAAAKQGVVAKSVWAARSQQPKHQRARRG